MSGMRKAFKVLIFGTGKAYPSRRAWYRQAEVVGFLDNDPKKQGTMVDGARVFSPDDGIRQPFDAVYVFGKYHEAMKEQLLSLGVVPEKIFNSDRDLRKLGEAKPVSMHGDPEVLRQVMGGQLDAMIAVVSYDMSLRGGPIALFHAAAVMKRSGYSVVVLTGMDGKLRDRYLSEGIPVIVDENLPFSRLADISWLQHSQMIVVNTIYLYYLLLRRHRQIPVLWWLHEPPVFYQWLRSGVEDLPRIDQENLFLYVAGDVARHAFEAHCTAEHPIRTLFYGVADEETTFGQRQKDTKKDSLVFAVVGNISELKGQDILRDAIIMLDQQDLAKSMFWFVGEIDSDVGIALKKEMEGCAHIRFIHEIPHECIGEVYRAMDVLICSSREDTMPTVVTEAAMHGVPAIVSNAVGTSKFIRNGDNGLVFRTEDASSLAEKIRWCIAHRQELPRMGKQARKIYEDNFSMSIFAERMNGIVQDILCHAGKVQCARERGNA